MKTVVTQIFIFCVFILVFCDLGDSGRRAGRGDSDTRSRKWAPSFRCSRKLETQVAGKNYERSEFLVYESNEK